MIECPECGARNSADSTFCIRCGSQFRAGGAPAVAARQPGPQSARVLDEATLLFQQERLDEAAEACHTAIDIDPASIAARSLLGMIEEERGNLAEALAEYEAVVRMAPERALERERAEKLRARLPRDPDLALAAVTVPGETPRRLSPTMIAVGVGVLVLIIGFSLMAAFSGGPDQTPSDDLVGPAPDIYAPAVDDGSGGTQEAPLVSALPSGGPGTTPIRPSGQDQSALQPANATAVAARSGGGGGGGVAHSVGPIREQALPPPTVDRDIPTSGPLTVPGATQPAPALPTSSGPPITVQPSQPRPTSSAPQAPRGSVQIWVGDEPPGAPPQAAGTNQSNGYPAPSRDHRQVRPGGAAAPATGSHSALPARVGQSTTTSGTRYTTQSGTRATNTGASRVPARPGQATSTSGTRYTPQQASRGPAAAATVGQWNGGTSAASNSNRYRPAGDRYASTGQSGRMLSGAPTASNGYQGPAYTGPRTNAGGSSTAARPGAPSANSGAPARNPQVTRSSGGSAYAPSARVSSGAAAPAPPPPSRPAASDSASDLRRRAQQAQASGRRDEARSLYRSAIQGYRAEGAGNPSRGAASQGAIESCQRALEAMDAH